MGGLRSSAKQASPWSTYTGIDKLYTWFATGVSLTESYACLYLVLVKSNYT